jgi:hypothetical protein
MVQTQEVHLQTISEDDLVPVPIALIQLATIAMRIAILGMNFCKKDYVILREGQGRVVETGGKLSWFTSSWG